MIDKMIVYVSVPSLGDSFFMLKSWAYQRMSSTSFRPLIRGFFFYVFDTAIGRVLLFQSVSVPSFGDSFFMDVYIFNNVAITIGVSVPSFGDSFFILSL